MQLIKGVNNCEAIIINEIINIIIHEKTSIDLSINSEYYSDVLFEEWDNRLSIKGVQVQFGTDAENESDELGLTIEDIVLGIKEGEPCPKKWERKKDHYEVCIKWGKKIIRIVYIFSYWLDIKCECIFVKHIGEVYQ